MSKKANEHLLKYSVVTIYLDKLEGWLLSPLATYKIVCQAVGQFGQNSEEQKSQTKVSYFAFTVKPPAMKRWAVESPAHLCRRVPISLYRFSSISLLGWNGSLFTCLHMCGLLLFYSTINICTMTTWKVYFVDKGPLGSWTKMINIFF